MVQYYWRSYSIKLLRLNQEQQMAKVRAEQLAALQMFSDDSDEDGEQGTPEDTEMQSEAVGGAGPAKTAKETGCFSSSISSYVSIHKWYAM